MDSSGSLRKSLALFTHASEAEGGDIPVDQQKSVELCHPSEESESVIDSSSD